LALDAERPSKLLLIHAEALARLSDPTAYQYLRRPLLGAGFFAGHAMTIGKEFLPFTARDIGSANNPCYAAHYVTTARARKRG